MIRLGLYLFGAWWVLKQMGYEVTKAKPVQGYGEVHDPFEHPLGEETCQVCAHHHPDIEARLNYLESIQR